MKLYCLIENDAITDGPRPIPSGWKNISGLDCLSDATLKTHGWLPMTQTTPTFDSATQKLGEPILDSIGEDEVVYTRNIITITDEERIKTKISQIVAAEYDANRVSAIEDLKTDGVLAPDYVD